jgi:acetylornithine deacetylase/succinyl-diaminopimelate desuccinylase-like protein
MTPLSPLQLLQTLLRFDTTNPPGNETEIIAYLQGLLADAGLSTVVLSKAPDRPNLIARLPGRGEAPPLLLYGHVDVVTTANQTWQHPPFAAEIHAGELWGRGTLDMKGGVAMMVTAVLRAQATGQTPPGDIILALVSDEEASGDFGARFLVEAHPEQFAGVRYAIGEGGGPAIYLNGRKFYTIMVAEKRICSLRATVRGQAGHGSMPVRGQAMARLAALLNALDRRHLPVHITPVPRQMLTTMSDHLPLPTGPALRQLLNPALTDRLLDTIGSSGRLLNPLLHNTVSPTIVQGGNKLNVIPSEINLELDGRLLPGFTPDDMLRELRDLVGDGVELTVTRHDPYPGEPDLTWYDTLAAVIRRLDPMGIPVPLLLSGVTDGRYFAQLGIQTYGFLPMDLPTGLIETIHAADERIPVGALEFGTQAISDAMRRIGGKG